MFTRGSPRELFHDSNLLHNSSCELLLVLAQAVVICSSVRMFALCSRFHPSPFMGPPTLGASHTRSGRTDACVVHFCVSGVGWRDGGVHPTALLLVVTSSTTSRSREHGGRRSCGHGSVPLLVSSVRVVCVALWVHRAGRRPTGKGREQQGVVGRLHIALWSRHANNKQTLTNIFTNNHFGSSTFVKKIPRPPTPTLSVR